ncbi:hypothetical protein [Anaerococcus sp.]|uniref:hypothetical protein n=1 Tax=Anaerococcus sp. TaxID=1872515 RepID=UPI00280BA1F0|nr:hypothetical protein [Anaerococcus sp.]MDU3176661.1 hypothetical protein [Anaerococcus sp.]
MPDIIHVEQSKNNYKKPVLLVRCTVCGGYYALEFKLDNRANMNAAYIEEYNYLPSVRVELPKQIDEVIPEFREIYEQAEIAKQMGLDWIAGMGYRRSLEFLVKKYLSYKFPDSKDSFLRMTLNQAIKEIDDERLENTAKFSSYLGNDESHILVKFEDKDIDDLKLLINKLTNDIASDIIEMQMEQKLNERN